MTDTAKIDASVLRQKYALILLCKTLCAIPAPSHQEKKRADFIRRWLIAAGGEQTVIDSAQNVLVPFRCEESNAITLFMAHTDTVFPDMEPIAVTERDGKLFAPGIGDDTSNVAILMMLVRMLLQSGAEPENGVLFAFNSCEEGLGNLKGCRRIMDDYAGRIKEVISFDGYYDSICNRAVGSARYRVEVKTKGGHSYAAFGNVSAIHILSAMITTLYTLKLSSETDRTTYNAGCISGGTSVNTIAQQAEMLFEYRSDKKEGMDRMKQFFDSVIQAYRSMEAEINTTLLGERPCMGMVDPAAEAALTIKAAECIKAVTGIEAPEKASSTDCNIPFSLGIPAVSFGLLNGGGAHTREEWVEIDSLCAGMEIGRRLIFPYFGLSPAANGTPDI